MKNILVVLIMLGCSLLICQTTVTDSLASVVELEGTIMLGHNGAVLFIDHPLGFYHIGDGFSSFMEVLYVNMNYISFPIPRFLEAADIVNVRLFGYFSSCRGDDVINNYPVYQLPDGNASPFCLFTHIDYGFNLDFSDVYAVGLNPTMIMLSSASFSPNSWHNIDITDCYRDDIQNNRLFSQYKIVLQYQQSISDWDPYGDSMNMEPFAASVVQQNPYILVEYLPHTTPPVITHTALTEVSPEHIPFPIDCTVEDNATPLEVQLIYYINEEDSVVIDMYTVDEIHFHCNIAPQLPITGGSFYYKIKASDAFSNDSYTPVSGWYQVPILPTGIDDCIATSANILDISPNPFNLSTTITFSAPAKGNAGLAVYNVKGQQVKQLVNAELNKGQHKVIWDGTDDSRQPVTPGIYFIRLDAGGQSSVHKVILMK